MAIIGEEDIPSDNKSSTDIRNVVFIIPRILDLIIVIKIF